MRTGHTLSVLLLAAIVACGRGGAASGDVDTALLHRTGGDVMLVDGERIAYEITSERYRQWEAARRALRTLRISLTMRLDPLRVTEAEIQRAVDFFERNGKARRAIEQTGMSVRDYVLTTLALEQQMAVATGRWGEARERPRVPSAPVIPPESIAAELARDTARRVDTVPVVDTVVIPVDTARPRPRPDTTPPPPGTKASPSPSPTP
jgi:hypothetical protein